MARGIVRPAHIPAQKKQDRLHDRVLALRDRQCRDPVVALFLRGCGEDRKNSRGMAALHKHDAVKRFARKFFFETDSGKKACGVIADRLFYVPPRFRPLLPAGLPV